MSRGTSSGDTVVVNGAGPVGLTFATALLDISSPLGLQKPHVQIWDPNMKPWRETVIRLPHSIAAALPEQVQQELWDESVSRPRRLFVPGPCSVSSAVENSRVHDPYNSRIPPCQYTALVQLKHFQEATMRYLMEHHAQHCTLNHGRCPPEVMREAAAVIQSYGKTARKTNPIAGNPVAEEAPVVGMEVPHEHGLFVLFDRRDVVAGERDPDFEQFNQCGNGFAVFQSHRLEHAVQVYIWPEHARNDTGCASVPTSPEDLVRNARSFGLRALFDCVPDLQGQENWWWEVSRRCRMQGADGSPVPAEATCKLEWREGFPGWRSNFQGIGQKASSPAFEAWFDAVRYQVSFNLYKMGIFGSCAEHFLSKVRLCYARREPYRYDSVHTEVEGVPVIYLGDSAGSTDFKKGLSCGRGLLCASRLAFDTVESVFKQITSIGSVDWKEAFRYGAGQYQHVWSSPEMVCEWREDFDATFKYIQAGRCDPTSMQRGLQLPVLYPQLARMLGG